MKINYTNHTIEMSKKEAKAAVPERKFIAIEG